MMNPDLNDILNRIKLEEMPEADLYYAKLHVVMKDGKEFIETVNCPKGDPLRNPMSKEEIIDKFRINVDFGGTVTHKNAEKLLAALENIEEVDNIEGIVQMLV